MRIWGDNFYLYTILTENIITITTPCPNISPDHVVTLRATLTFSYPRLTRSLPIYFITKLFEKHPLCIHFGGLCESKAIMSMKRKHSVLVISSHSTAIDPVTEVFTIKKKSC